MFFTEIRKSKHYKEHHEIEVPWSEAVSVILNSSKKMRKKGNKIEIETKTHYVLCEKKDGVLWVINAKRR